MNKCSILIVDDNETDRYLLKRVIHKLDIATEIFEAENGRTALDFLSNFEENSREYQNDFPPVFIFLDINMPIMNGFEFLEEFTRLKNQGENYSSSIIMMYSSSERDEDKTKIHSFTFVKGFITKGDLSPESLRASIEECLSNS